MPFLAPFGALPSLPLPARSGPVELQPPSEGPKAPGQVQVLKRWFRFTDGQKVAWLRSFATQYGKEPEMRFFVVEQVLRNDPTMQRDYAKQAQAILRWAQDNILYLNESGEVIQNPWVTIKKKVADCDDLAILMASMAESIALPWRFMLAGREKGTGKPVRWMAPEKGMASPPRNVDWVHIYIAFGDKPFGASKWIPAEATIKGAPLGYDPVLHGPLADTHMRGRWTGQLPELSGPVFGATAPGQTAAPTIQAIERQESFDWRDETKDVLRDGLKFGLSGAIAGFITAMFIKEGRKR